MNIDKLPARLFNLLTSSSFEELSEKDKNEIQMYLTPDEYSEMRQFVQEFSEMDNALENSIGMDMAFEESNIDKPKLWRSIINYPVPLYKVAAVFLALIGLFTLYQNKEVFTQNVEFANIEKNMSIKDGFYPENLVFEL